MKIDYELNPLAIVKRFEIPYGERNELRLEGRIRIYARGEEGLDEVNWFDGEIRYNNPGCTCEVGGQVDKLYKSLTKGAETISEVEKKLKVWCRSMGLKISNTTAETAGVKN